MPEPMLQPMRTASSSGQRVTGGQAAVLYRLDRGGEPEVDEAVHVTRFLLGDVFLDVETLDLARELAGEGRSRRTW
jgi:hypothetical protein